MKCEIYCVIVFASCLQSNHTVCDVYLFVAYSLCVRGLCLFHALLWCLFLADDYLAVYVFLYSDST